MPSEYIAAAVAILVGIGFGLALLLVARLPRRRMTAGKAIPYECGSDVLGSPRTRTSVKFFRVAILFLVFDIEVAFLYPWALQYRELSCATPIVNGTCLGGVSAFGFVEMLVFMAVLVVALAYVWRKRQIGWE